ncbi:MAG: hypothetical protein K8R88_10470 [Armatimonadetes bacterium]|nr:hypothetical protein [Armatimonadota bacterium]
MNTNKLKSACRMGLVCAALMVTAFAVAQDSDLAKRVDISLSDADLYTATQLLTSQTGLQFVIEAGDKAFAPINVSLKDRTAEEAIRYICDAAGAWAERDESGVFIIHRGKRPMVGTSTASNPQVVQLKVIKKLRMKHASASDVLSQINAVDIFDPLRGIKEINAFNEAQAPRNRTTSNIFVVGSGPVPNQAYPISSQPGATESRFRGTSNPLESGSDVVLPGDESANQRGGGGAGGFGGGGQGGGLGNPGGGGQGGGQGQQGGTTITSGQGFAPDGLDRVTYDPTDNSLVVQGTEEAIRQLRNLVDLFDTVPQQVIIKVEFIQTSIGVARDLGFDWLYQRGGVAAGNRPGTFAKVGDPLFINYATGNVTTRMRTFIQDSDGKTVNAPLIRTLNNQLASVNQTTTTTIFVAQTTAYDGYITMILQPQVSDFGQLRTGPSGQEFPDTITQSLFVTARVKSGSTIALGGINRKQFSNSVQKFPVLGDLPIIGQFFRSTSKQRNDSETLIFITPTIVADEDAGGLQP